MLAIGIDGVPYSFAMRQIAEGRMPNLARIFQAGTVRPLGVTTAQRSPVLPDVPPIAEAGLPGYDTGVWWGFLAPAGLPARITAKLAKDCADVVKVPAVRERLFSLGATPIGSSPQEFADLIRSDYEKWGPVIKAAGIKGD